MVNTHVPAVHRTTNVDVVTNTDNQIPAANPRSSLNVPEPAIPSTSHQVDVDHFDHILQVTSHQEAVYAYYYMDENNRVCRKPFSYLIIVLNLNDTHFINFIQFKGQCYGNI